MKPINPYCFQPFLDHIFPTFFKNAIFVHRCRFFPGRSETLQGGAAEGRQRRDAVRPPHAAAAAAALPRGGQDGQVFFLLLKKTEVGL